MGLVDLTTAVWLEAAYQKFLLWRQTNIDRVAWFVECQRALRVKLHAS